MSGHQDGQKRGESHRRQKTEKVTKSRHAETKQRRSLEHERVAQGVRGDEAGQSSRTYDGDADGGEASGTAYSGKTRQRRRRSAGRKAEGAEEDDGGENVNENYHHHRDRMSYAMERWLDEESQWTAREPGPAYMDVRGVGGGFDEFADMRSALLLGQQYHGQHQQHQQHQPQPGADAAHHGIGIGIGGGGNGNGNGEMVNFQVWTDASNLPVLRGVVTGFEHALDAYGGMLHGSFR